MLQRMRRVRDDLRDDDSGFTLTELLITIIILGILAGIVVFAVINFTDESQQTACSADKRSVQTAVEAYHARNPGYPANIAALVPTYLREAPSSTAYTISLNSTTGLVTGTMTAGGAAC